MRGLEKRIESIKAIGQGMHNFFSNLSEDVKKRIVAYSLLLSAIGFAVGCGSGGGGGGSSNGGGGGTDQVSAYVKAEEGATLQLEDYKVTIPAGALKNDTTVEIGKSPFGFPQLDEMDYSSDVLYVDLNNTGLNSNINITLPFYQPSSKTSSKTLEAITREQFIDSLVGVVYDFGTDFYSIREIAVDQSRDLLTMYYSASTLVDRLETRAASIPNLVQSANLDTNYFTQTDLNSSDPVCLLIHGFTDTTSNAFGYGYDSTKLRGYLEDIYVNRIWSFNYSSGKDIKTNVTTLEGLVNALNPKFEFDIVAHSMGGDLARYYARKNPSRVRKLVMLGSPNEGVPLNAYENAFNQRMHGIIDFLHAITPPWSPGAKDLLEGSSFLSELNSNIGNISAKYCTIAGNSNSWWIAGDDDGLVPVSSVHINDGSPAQRETPESIESYTKDGTDHGGLLLYSGGVFDWVLDFLKASVEKIVFTSNRDGDTEIYAINPDGSGLEQLTSNSYIGDSTPVWSPDRTKIAFASTRDVPLNYGAEIYIMNADGSDVKRLTYTSADGKRGSLPWGWSPASNKVAYSYDVGGNYEIYTVDVNNRNLERLTYTDADDYYPSWSSKDEIAFASEINSGTAMDIYIMNANGTNLQRLTSNVGYNLHPDWSPDGSKIAFTSNRDGRQRIYVMNKDGSNVQKVSPDSLYWCSVSRWSPDGKKFVLNGDVNEMTIYLSADLYIMNSDGTGLANITNNVPISNIYPDW